jgi:hypothetical protein
MAFVVDADLLGWEARCESLALVWWQHRVAEAPHMEGGDRAWALRGEDLLDALVVGHQAREEHSEAERARRVIEQQRRDDWALREAEHAVKWACVARSGTDGQRRRGVLEVKLRRYRKREVRDRDREGDREGVRERDSETDRQTDRQTDAHIIIIIFFTHTHTHTPFAAIKFRRYAIDSSTLR